MPLSLRKFSKGNKNITRIRTIVELVFRKEEEWNMMIRKNDDHENSDELNADSDDEEDGKMEKTARIHAKADSKEMKCITAKFKTEMRNPKIAMKKIIGSSVKRNKQESMLLP